jgi:hypothetical protein
MSCRNGPSYTKEIAAPENNAGKKSASFSLVTTNFAETLAVNQPFGSTVY